ncbi:uncharacterized protein LOC133194675 [Saccostrea echinata]|uniref:uncharacterized protein LOC133194675 n=1 Tax=Saccostrea echinata TaxID=191078 RepID=UPI002A80EE7A|nr:uncharacterized protein LOC133194675 [Saccostrea echinata]
MDLQCSAQVVIRCDLCETAGVQMLCDFCHVNLCIACIGKHVSDGYEKHKVVPFKVQKSTLIYPRCTMHPTKSCDLQCKECNISVCSFCSESKQHEEHDLVHLSEIFAAKKVFIENDETELEKYISSTYRTIVIEIEAQMARLHGDYEKLTEFVTERGKQWHRAIERVTKEMVVEINEMKGRHQSILKQQLDEIGMIQSLIDETLLTMKKIKESNDVSMALEYTSRVKEFKKSPKVQISLPTFSPQYIDSEQVHKLFGSLSPLLAKREADSYRLLNPEATVKALLEEPKLISSINTGCKNLCSVTCLSEEEIWTSSGVSGLMQCFNTQSSLETSVKAKSREFPSDITLTSDGDLLYSDWKTKTVNILKNKKIKEVIRLHGWIPNNMCVTSSGDLLVTMYSDDKTQSKVVRYSGSTEKETIQFDDEGKPLYSGNKFTKYISENRNLDICVSDYGAGAVVVVNQAGKLMFRYTGHISTIKIDPFKPRGITTNSHYQILASDYENHCIHILDQDGHFLRYVDNVTTPYGLCVNKSDYLFVAENYTGNVKKIKYIKY